jgi:hypothetical protein
VLITGDRYDTAVTITNLIQLRSEFLWHTVVKYVLATIGHINLGTAAGDDWRIDTNAFSDAFRHLSPSRCGNNDVKPCGTGGSDRCTICFWQFFTDEKCPIEIYSQSLVSHDCSKIAVAEMYHDQQ